MRDEGFSEDPFMLKYCFDRYKTHEMSDKAIDDFLPTLKFVPYWFVRNRMNKYLKCFICR